MLPNKNLLWVFFLLTILLSCEYEPTIRYFKDIEKPDSTDIHIELNDQANDTIFLYQRTVVGYTMLLGKHKLKKIEATLGDSYLLYSDQPMVLVIDPDYIQSGTYILHVKLRASSGTGSIADLRDSEEVEIVRDWVVVIDKSPPDPVHIISIEKKDGRLEIKWEPYNKFNFQYYRLLKYCYDEYYQDFEHCSTQIFTSMETISTIDSSFIGGRAKYILAVVAANQPSDQDEKEIQFPYDPDLSYTWTDKSNIKLSWRKPEFYNNLGTYEIYFPNDNDTRTFSVYQVNDTTLVVDSKIKFPAYKMMRLTAKPKMSNNYNSGDRYSDTTAMMGGYFPVFTMSTLVYSPGLDKYFAAGYDSNVKSIVRINTQTFEVEQSFPSVQGSFGVSPNGQYFYVIDGYTLSRLDPLDFSVIQTYNLTTNYDPSYPWTIKVSDTNRLMAGSVVGSSVWDMNGFTRIQEFPVNNINKISADGNYIAGFSKLLQFNGSNFVEITSMGVMGGDGDFTTDNRFVSYFAGAIKVFNLNTLTLERSILSEAAYLSMDPKTNLIGGFTDDYSGPKKFYVFSHTQNTAIKEFDIANVSAQYSDLVLVNDHLICSCGATIPLSWYE